MKRNYRRNARARAQIKHADQATEAYALRMYRARRVQFVIWTLVLLPLFACSFVAFLCWLGGW